MEVSGKKTAVRPNSTPQKKKSSDSSPDGTQSRPRVALPSNLEPTYYIGGGNGNALIEEVMNDLGWKRVRDKSDDTVRLRWCEVKGGINYNAFKEGEQMVNRIPNGNLLTNKLGLLNSLQELGRVSSTCQTPKRSAIKLDFIPETYRLDDPRDRDTFREVFKENEIWICKPTGRNQGKGIFLVRTMDELQQAVAETDEVNVQNQQQGKPKKPLNRIIQRYIMNPLLLDGRKFDIRCYMLIANAVPLLVLYRKGYCRLSMYEYDNGCDNIITHLTNQFIQKRDPKYADVKDDTAWSMDKFNEYINEKIAPTKGLPKDWVYGHLESTIKQIMMHCVNAVKHKLQCKVGYFDMFGFDFMIDEDMKIWLIEVNVNPCLATNCAALKEAVPGVVREALHLAIECFEKSRRNRPLMPLQALKEFQVIYDASPKSTGSSGRGDGSPTRSRVTCSRTPKAPSPTRQVRSVSPVKESTSGASKETTRGKGNAESANNKGAAQPDATSPSKERKIRRSGNPEQTAEKRGKRDAAADDDADDAGGGDEDDDKAQRTSDEDKGADKKIKRKEAAECKGLDENDNHRSAADADGSGVKQPTNSASDGRLKGSKMSTSSTKIISSKSTAALQKEPASRKKKSAAAAAAAAADGGEDNLPNRGS